MAITPHGWHIPGSPMPEGHDDVELKLARQCGGPSNGCSICEASMVGWNKAMGLEVLRNSKKRRSNAVVHPAHYNQYEGIEIIDLVEQMNFNKGNAVKYITRAEFKSKEIEDLEKARFYLKKEIKRLKREQKE